VDRQRISLVRAIWLIILGLVCLAGLACRQRQYPMFCGDDAVGITETARAAPTATGYQTTLRVRVSCGDDITVPKRAAPGVLVQIRYLLDGSSDSVVSDENGSAVVEHAFPRDPTGSGVQVSLHSGTGTLTNSTTFTAR
jgi:hypothetical protein